MYAVPCPLLQPHLPNPPTHQPTNPPIHQPRIQIREENPRLARDSKILRVPMDNVYEVFTTPREQTGLQVRARWPCCGRRVCVRVGGDERAAGSARGLALHDVVPVAGCLHGLQLHKLCSCLGATCPA